MSREPVHVYSMQAVTNIKNPLIILLSADLINILLILLTKYERVLIQKKTISMISYIRTTILGILILSGLMNSIHAQVKLKRIPGTIPRVICYADEGISDRYIPAPEKYRSDLKSGVQSQAIIEINVINAPDTLAHVRAQEAADIWSTLIYSPVPIKIEVEFEELGAGTLGSTGPDGAYYVNDNGHLPRRVYFTALAEKLYGTNVNGSLPDMYVSMNTSTNWYFKNDSATGKAYDYKSVLIHEIAHGLGFFGLFYVGDDGLGYGSETPAIYDHFMENAGGRRITDTTRYPLGSLALGLELVKSPIYFKSPLALQELAEIPKLFVPSPWNSGSSIYHLDEVYNDKNDGRDALMTYSSQRGEVIHDPGPVTTMMFWEMGWLHTYILHDSLMDREDIVDPFTVTAEIYGDSAIKKSSPYLFYSFDDGQTFDSLNMTLTGGTDLYAADIPVLSSGIYVNYFLRVEDTLGREYTLPAEAPENSFRFYVGTDTISPTIEYMPIKYMLITEDSLEVLAKIWDNLGIDTAQIEYMINDVNQVPIDLIPDTLSDYKAYFTFSAGQLSVGDRIKYRIKVVDGSQAENTVFHPVAGYHAFDVEDIPVPQDEYQNDFEIDDGDFLISGTFSRQKPDGFSSYALHSEHPYPEPADDNTFWDFTAQLRFPIRLSATNSLMTFDEVAFIEPGNPGTDWGDESFWDYVIVEGSEDGKEWFELTEGYDCREYQEWEDGYDEGGMDGNLALGVADESHIKTRLVDLVADSQFDAGDTILIRFRLNSDPYSNGWGWMIDNLKIQGTTLIPEYPLIQETISVYPNPSTGYVSVNMQMREDVEQLNILVLDLIGREIISEKYNYPGQQFSRQFNLNDLSNGIYLMEFRSGDQRIMKKIILAR
jgi:hypothetical protein